MFHTFRVHHPRFVGASSGEITYNYNNPRTIFIQKPLKLSESWELFYTPMERIFELFQLEDEGVQMSARYRKALILRQS